MAQAGSASRKTRIQAQNEELILKAALEAFSAYGFRGATVDQIATNCGLSKPNLLYYFRRKEDIYIAVLEHTLQDWLEPLRQIDPDGEPIDEITRYIRTKIRLSRDNPKASRLFANEILHGASAIGDYLKGPLKNLVDEKAAIISRWIAEGRLNPVDPHHLIFAIWATTQHYADFETQVTAVVGNPPDLMSKAEETLTTLLVEGLRVRP
jgi:TetR/AcrR family transcriptional regulator